MEKILRTKAAKELFEVIASLQDWKECRNLLRDACTLSELKAIIERFQVAKLVDCKETYRNISKKTGASSATVTRVAHWLHHGRGGYRLALDRMK